MQTYFFLAMNFWFKFIFCAKKVIRQMQGEDYFLYLKSNSLNLSQSQVAPLFGIVGA